MDFPCQRVSSHREALAVEFGDTRLLQEHLSEPTFIVEECKGLLSYDEATGLVTFTHYAVSKLSTARGGPRPVERAPFGEVPLDISVVRYF